MAAEIATVPESTRLSLCTIGDLILDVVVLPDRPLAPEPTRRRRSASPRAVRPRTLQPGRVLWAPATA
jgi:hypothetical protein